MATPSPIVPEEHLAPYKLRDLVRKSVNEALAAMESDEYQLAMDDLSPEERRNAILAHGKLYRVKVKLVNAQLEEIRDGLKENEAALIQATDDLKEKLGNLEKVTAILGAANTFLAVIGKVITLV